MLDSHAVVGTVVAFAVVFFVPRIIQVIGAYRSVAWHVNPPPAPIFRRASRQTLALAIYIALIIVSFFFTPAFFAAFFAYAGLSI